LLIDDEGLSERVIGCAIAVHRELGPGLFESIYEEAMTIELAYSGIQFSQQVKLPIVYRDQALSKAYKLDLLIENRLVLELKNVEVLHPLHEAQLLSYMRLGGWKMGLLINFNVELLKQGLRRFVR